MNTNAEQHRIPQPDPERARVYPIETFLTVQMLLEKLNMTPADGLQLLAEALEDLDRQIVEFEAEGDGMPF